MKKTVLFLILSLITITSYAQSVRYQKGYTKKDGTYVQGHYKTKTNSTNHDNYSTRSNYNPYTGNTGSRAKDYSSGAYNYGAGQNVKTGPKGGQYYNNSSGNKTYVPKRNTSNSYYSTPQKRTSTKRSSSYYGRW